MVIKVDLNQPATQIFRTTERIAAWCGGPAKFRLDNAHCFIALALKKWAAGRTIALDFIVLGRPQQNGFIERSNGNLQRGVLDLYALRNLGEVREQAEQWPADYRTAIPDDGLGGLTPAELRQYHESETSRLA